jgi:hypothetical protein
MDITELTTEKVDQTLTPEPETPPVETTEPGEQKPEGDKPAEPEKEPEKDSSVIRQMRRMIKGLQSEINEFRMAAVKPTPEPERASFDTDDAYIKAVVDHRVNQAVSKVQPQTQGAAYESKLSAAREEHKDFDDVVENLAHVRMSEDKLSTVQQAIETLQYGGELYYHLAKNPEVAEELAILTPTAIGIRLGELHAEIKRAKSSPAKASNAPLPVKHVTPAAPVAKSYDEMTMEEFEAARRKERLAHKQRYVT